MLSSDTVQGFVSSLLQKNFDDAVSSPECHKEWWELFCNKHPYVAISAPRGHAKSTALTHGWTLAQLCFRERSYVIVVSDTVAQAVQFLGDMKKEFADNEQLRSLFGIKEFIKETEDDIIVSCHDGHQFRIQAKGSEQKVRGLKWSNKRPDLIVCDDLENDEIVLNKERRLKFKRWFNGALLPCMSMTGIVRYVGTILHSDSMLENLMPQAYEKYTVTEDLKQYSSKKPGHGGKKWLSVKYRAHNSDFSKILWASKAEESAKKYGIPGGAEGYFRWLRQGFVDQGIPDVYSMEYLNVPIDESMAYFKKNDFLAESETEKKLSLRYYITGDLAISKEETADYSVFLVAGVDENKVIHIKDVVRERMDGREIVDTILALERHYKPEAIGIEEMQVSKAIGPFLREEMISTNTFPSLIKLKHGGKDKIARSRSMQGRMRAHGVRFDKEAEWYPTFEDECISFPRAKHDDQVDCFAYLGMLLDVIIEAPTKEETEDELYADEYRSSGLSTTGRSRHTGY
jgi:predicted phage terminase large subunit-like protein